MSICFVWVLENFSACAYSPQPANRLLRRHAFALEMRNGTNTDSVVIKIAGISKNSYYKYKAELVEAAEH